LTCSATANARALAGVLLLLTSLGCGSAPVRSRTDLTNPFLGPEYSGWLIGPIALLATPEETDAFLALSDDAQAQQFVESFWDKRDANGALPGNPLRKAFEERAAQADRAFTEAGYLGRRTDRGAVFVLYGPPKKMDHEVSTIPGEPLLEVWIYDETSPAGLDGKRPASLYRFIKRGDLTVTYRPGRADPRVRDRPGMPPEPDGP
jgi:GWxTD domain-containing protein